MQLAHGHFPLSVAKITPKAGPQGIPRKLDTGMGRETDHSGLHDASFIWFLNS